MIKVTTKRTTTAFNNNSMTFFVMTVILVFFSNVIESQEISSFSSSISKERVDHRHDHHRNRSSNLWREEQPHLFGNNLTFNQPNVSYLSPFHGHYQAVKQRRKRKRTKDDDRQVFESNPLDLKEDEKWNASHLLASSEASEGEERREDESVLRQHHGHHPDDILTDEIGQNSLINRVYQEKNASLPSLTSSLFPSPVESDSPSSSNKTQKRGPNIIFILTDDQDIELGK